jgi:SAM-dependent methyltransferase
MSEEIGTGHSAAYFGATRDYWWNLDYLELIGKRLRLHRARDVLDVGCGVGHWGRLLASVLPPDARVTGIDRDPVWVEQAAARARAAGLSGRYDYRIGTGEAIPYGDASFDLVTCQTLLIHTPDPGAVIGEMIRVTRPGGCILAAEPNNVAASLVRDSVTFDDPVETIITRSRFQLVCERGKAALGEGNNSIGDLIPGLFAQRGLRDIRVYLNDKTSEILPPYERPEEQAALAESKEFAGRDFWIWSRADTRRYFAAGGGDGTEFDGLWGMVTGRTEETDRAVAEGRYAHSGAALSYIVAGTKP